MVHTHLIYQDCFPSSFLEAEAPWYIEYPVDSSRQLPHTNESLVIHADSPMPRKHSIQIEYFIRQSSLYSSNQVHRLFRWSQSHVPHFPCRSKRHPRTFHVAFRSLLNHPILVLLTSRTSTTQFLPTFCSRSVPSFFAHSHLRNVFVRSSCSCFFSLSTSTTHTSSFLFFLPRRSFAFRGVGSIFVSFSRLSWRWFHLFVSSALEFDSCCERRADRCVKRKQTSTKTNVQQKERMERTSTSTFEYDGGDRQVSSIVPTPFDEERRNG